MARRYDPSLYRYVPPPAKTDQPGTWVPMEPSYAPALGKKAISFFRQHTSTGARDGTVTTMFHAGYVNEMKEFMRVEGLRGNIEVICDGRNARSGRISDAPLAKVTWTHRYIVN